MSCALYRLLSCIATALLWIAGVTGTAAARRYPEKAVRFIVPYGVGGSGARYPGDTRQGRCNAGQ